MADCVTWECRQPGIAHLVISRPCGHPVSLNSSGERAHVRDGSPVQAVQRQWSCGACIRARSGHTAPRPSTCPVCWVRRPVRAEPMMHSAHVLAAGRCLTYLRDGVAATYSGPHQRETVTCPDCLEWMHA